MSHPVLAKLRAAGAGERRAACAAAAEDPSAVLLIDALVETLADPNSRVVRAAVDALEQIGRQHDEVLVALRPALLSDDPGQRFEAAWTWARLEPPPIKLLPALTATLASIEGNARWRAARLLVELGRLHGEVLPVVAGLASPEHTPHVRRIALAVLRELDPQGEASQIAHRVACRSGDPGLERFGITGLAGIGAANPEVWDVLRSALTQAGDPVTRRTAARAIGTLGDPPEKVRAALEEARERDPEPSVRATAGGVLEALRAGER